MRNAFAAEITRLAQEDERIVLLSGDIGNRLFDDFKRHCPNRFYNCGVAEANMIGVAAGLAASGYLPVCYTIAPFVTYRCLEQIRVDVCYHNVPVVIVGTGAGLSYASLGATHHSCEEMGMLRLLPNLSVLAPADSSEVRACLAAVLGAGKPAYIRIGKKGEPKIHAQIPDFKLGNILELRAGSDVWLLGCGTILSEVLGAADALTAAGLSVGVASVPSLKPLDTAFLAKAFHGARLVCTAEEHSISGGLGGAVAEWLADQRSACAPLLRFGTADEFLHETCEQEEAREHFGLTASSIAARVLAQLNA
jgi:transketolase